MAYFNLTKENINTEHICCAFSDKKCTDSYMQKKKWLKSEIEKGFVFKKLDERAKVFIEYGDAKDAWVPISAPNYLNIGCFWVSGKYKGQGHGKALLQSAIDEAKAKNKDGLVTVVGTKKFHFMSDTKWLLKQGFKVVDTTESGFSLITLEFNKTTTKPHFNECVKKMEVKKKGLVVYYTNCCPYSQYHVEESLPLTAKNRNLDLEIIKLNTMQEAQSSPTPATIFSLFLDGEFITTDISVCMDSRFDKIIEKIKGKK